MHRRTALITAASIVAVVLTGATAVGANIDILSSAAASNVGDLTAVAQVEPIPTTGPSTPPASIATAVPTPEGPSMTVQAFEADAAGIVNVQFNSDEIRLGSVSPDTGWSWTSTQSGDTELRVSFLSADGQELEFVATLQSDGSIAAKVDETIIETVQGEAEVITVHTQATPGPATAAQVAPPSADSSGGAVNAQPAPVDPAPPQSPAQTPALAIAAPPASVYSDDDDDDDQYEDDERDDDERDDDERDDEDDEEDDEDEYDEDEYDEDEYEGADDDD